MSTTVFSTCCTTASAGDEGGEPGSSSSDADNPPQPPPARSSPGTIEVIGAPGAWGPWLHEHLAAALTHLDRSVAAVTVKIVDDRRMRALHEEYRGTNDSTDVLTFPHSADDAPVEADIVICLDEARRRSRELGHAIEQELLLYALHGVLHCVGFDDQTPDDFEAMHAEEDRILTALGVGPTFGRGGPS